MRHRRSSGQYHIASAAGASTPGQHCLSATVPVQRRFRIAVVMGAPMAGDDGAWAGHVLGLPCLAARPPTFSITYQRRRVIGAGTEPAYSAWEVDVPLLNYIGTVAWKSQHQNHSITPGHQKLAKNITAIHGRSGVSCLDKQFSTTSQEQAAAANANTRVRRWLPPAQRHVVPTHRLHRDH